MFLARAEEQYKKAKMLKELQNRQLKLHEERREGVAKKHAESAKALDVKRSQNKADSPRNMKIVGGAGGYEGGAPSGRALRPADDRAKDGGHGSPTRTRPTGFKLAGLYGESVPTFGMSNKLTDKPNAKGKLNTAEHQPHGPSGHGGQYVPYYDMTDNTRSKPSPDRAPASPFSGKRGYKEGGVVKAKRVGKPSAWISHVKAYQAQHGVSYRDAMVGAKATYQK
jgi:hypothetical protein